MIDSKLLAAMLGIEAPWGIGQIRQDLGRDQIDIWVGRQKEKTGWLFGSRQRIHQGVEQSAWRHINLGVYRCIIHGSPPGDGPLPGWATRPGTPFSQDLARRVVDLLREGVSLQALCNLLDIPVADLWKFKHQMDSGQIRLQGVATPGAPDTAAALPGGVPASDDPVWLSLLEGHQNLDIRALGLKFLLTKLRTQVAAIDDREVRTLKVCELQRYFLQNHATLAHEIAQIRGAGLSH